MLVSKGILITDTPVELLAGEDTSQAYALHLAPVGTGVWIGGPDVSATEGVDASMPTYPLVIQGESVWAVTDGSSVGLRVLAYSTPEG